MIDVPHTELSSDALRGLIEHFVLREGTDYGQVEYSLADKVAAVIKQLERGQAKIVFDEKEESFDIVRL
jgi:uncharacterized protein YheU (UPF0270 family)